MRSRTILIASLASLLAMPALAVAADKPATDGETVHCYGVNKCKGVGDCGGKGHSCAGKNACKGRGYLDMSKDLCLRIEGGRLTENPKPVATPKEQPRKS